MRYRAEIDGLRAVAVVPVVITHAFPSVLSGGFAGVDVFFAISGFLITSLILEEMSSGSFSLADFYVRRARRILPALFVMLLVVVALGYVLMLPHAYERTLKGAAAAALFLANVHYWEVADYFAPSTALSPLVHTWSLAVEEQYYLLFPPLVWLIWVLSGRTTIPARGLFVVLLLGGSLSFALCVWGSSAHPEVNFFFTPSRIWELFLGAGCALYVSKNSAKALSHSGIAPFMTLAGLLAILASYVLLDEQTPYPSFGTLAPVLGACAVLLFADTTQPIVRLLSSRAFVGIGLISYSLYLWHQPTLAFLRIHYPSDNSLPLLIGILISVILGYLSWRWVEQPTRHAKLSTPFVFLSSGAVMACSVAAFLWLASERRDTLVFQNLSDDKQKIMSFLDRRLDRTALYLYKRCFDDKPLPDLNACSTIQNQKNSLFLWGDSHAAGMAIGLRKRVPAFASYATKGCKIFAVTPDASITRCAENYAQIISALKTQQPSVVMLHKSWSHEPDKVHSVGHTIETIKQLSPQSKIILVGGVPHWMPSLPRRLISSVAPLIDGMFLKADLEQVIAADALLERQAELHGVTFISLLNELCSGQSCLAILRNKTSNTIAPLAFDYGHLTETGSDHVADILLKKLEITGLGQTQ